MREAKEIIINKIQQSIELKEQRSNIIDHVSSLEAHHKLTKFLSIINIMDHQAATLVEILVL